jgi:hypothetical protein
MPQALQNMGPFTRLQRNAVSALEPGGNESNALRGASGQNAHGHINFMGLRISSGAAGRKKQFAPPHLNASGDGRRTVSPGEVSHTTGASAMFFRPSFPRNGISTVGVLGALGDGLERGHAYRRQLLLPLGRDFE